MTAVIVLVLVAVVLAALVIVRRNSRPGSPDQGAPLAGIEQPVAAASPASNSANPDSPVNDPLKRGIRLFMQGQYTEAFPLLEPSGHQGSLKAQQLLAKMYYAGNGVPKDLDKYYYWLEQAAANGDRPSRIKVKKMKRAESLEK